MKELARSFTISDRLQTLRASAGLRHSLIMAAATFVAGGLDYLFNILTGRWLDPVEFGTFVSVTAILQVAVYLTNVIRNVVAHYTARLASGPNGAARTGAFLRRRWRWAWRWGLVAALLLFLLSPPLARLLRLPGPQPLWAASLALLLLFLRPVTDGALQGAQQFTGLGGVQVLQAFLRLLLLPLFIWLGWAAFGALLSLPLAMAGGMLLAFWLLAPTWRSAAGDVATAVSWRYSAQTLLGLLALALMINMDAILVKLAFDPVVAGNYGPVVTLGKINLFLPLAMGLVLFPKATQRQAAGRDPRPILFAALGATLLPGLALTAFYFLAPGPIVETIFTGQYADPGLLLGVVGLATTLYAGLNIWLNYALSLTRPSFVYALALVVSLQAAGMAIAAFFYSDLLWLTLMMVVGGLAGNLAGLVLLGKSSEMIRT